MKKIIILVMIAAAVGFLLSKTGREDETGRDNTELSTISVDNNTEEGEIISDAQSTRERDPHEGGRDRQSLAQRDGNVERKPPRTGAFPAEVVDFILEDSMRKKDIAPIYNAGRDLLDDYQWVESRRKLTKVYMLSSGQKKQDVRGLLDDINEKLIFNPSYKDGATIHQVGSGEVLSNIARQYGVNWRMLTRINNIARPELIRVNQKIKVLEGQPKVVVDKNSFTLTLFIDDYYVKEYPVGLGREIRTPEGVFTVDSMLIEADWYPPEGGLIRYGEEGHLIGSRWIGFEDKPDASGYGIHGTIDPDSIGSTESEGCIRMLDEDVEELYDFLTTGTEVLITG